MFHQHDCLQSHHDCLLSPQGCVCCLHSAVFVSTRLFAVSTGLCLLSPHDCLLSPHGCCWTRRAVCCDRRCCLCGQASCLHSGKRTMPTLRRSKSLNDKITRQKNRTGDVIRDPRSPDVEGRTRTCVDNFQVSAARGATPDELLPPPPPPPPSCRASRDFQAVDLFG